jgi:hypothetical protein
MQSVFSSEGDKKFVGKLEVFQQQIEASKNCYDVFFRDNSEQSPILLGECQAGKTGSAIILIKMFMQWCDFRNISNKEREIYFAINSSNNDLLKQIDLRLLQSGLSQEVIPMHHAHYKKQSMKVNPNIKARLFIVDECHIALGTNPSQMKPFERFLHECGIDIAKKKNQWRNPNNFLLQISATPNAHVMFNEIKNKTNDEPFQFIYLENDPSYLSVSDMVSPQKNRVRQSHNLFCTTKENKNQPSPFFTDRIQEFYDMTKDEYGVLILRLTGEQRVRNLHAFLKSRYKDVFEVKDYNAKNKNICDISNEISMVLPKPLIAIVRGSLREGKTLDSTKYIKMIIDSHDTVSSTVIQGLLGRCCGYPINGHSKHDDNFIIYCDREEIDDHVSMLEKIRAGERPTVIPGSRYNTKSSNSKKYNYKVSILPRFSEEAICLEEQRKIYRDNKASSSEFREELLEKFNREYKDGRTTYKDADSYIEDKIKKLMSVTAQQSSNKSQLLLKLVNRFCNAYFDDEHNCFRVSESSQVSSDLGYEIINGFFDKKEENEGCYMNLFSILNEKLNLDIEKEYIIFYERDDYVDVTSVIEEKKLQNSILKNGL